MRCLIVDDDPMAVAVLSRYAGEAGMLEVVGTCTSPAEALRALSRHTVDLLFLDMEMPDMTGLELLGALEERPLVVMVTGNPDYAVDAFEADIADFLVKPVSYARFLKAMARVRRLAGRTREERWIFVKTEGRILRLAIEAVDRIEAERDYVQVHSGNQAFKVHSTLKRLEERLPADEFIRVHRSHIVRLDCIVDMEQGSIVVGKAVIPVGDSYRAALLARMDLP